MTNKAGTSPAPEPHLRAPQALEPLRLPGFRRFMVMTLVFTAAVQMEVVALGWLVYDITRSNLALGVVSAMWNITLFIFSPLAGAIADRVDRRRLVMATWGVVAINYAVLTLLILTGAIEIWHLVVASLLNGMLFAFNIPARVALISQLVGDTRLMGAMALISVAFNLTGILVPLAGGAIVDLVGAGGAYLAMTVLYVIVIVLVGYLPLPQMPVRSGRDSVLGDLVAGLRFVRRERMVGWLLFLAVVVVVLGQSYLVLLPGFAADTLKVPASGLGLLFSMVALGALAGNLLVAQRGGRPGLGRWMFLLGATTGLGLIGLALARSLYPALAVLFLLGVTGPPFTTINQTLIQLLAAPELRGRVQSLYMLTWASMPLGTMPLAALADRIGAKLPLLFAGAATILLMALVAAFQRRLLRLPILRPEAAVARTG